MSEPLQIGRYVLHGEIASGGMATVHYGRLVGDAGFSKTVAIKRLHRSLAHNASFRGMILEEGRLAARVRHPNVVPPLDVLAEGGELLLVMEYVHGESLSRLLRVASHDGERVPLPVAAAILSNVLHGLHAAHEAVDELGNPLAIVHRDVSPQNIIVGTDGAARVIDFGIAKAATSEGMTSTGTIKGKVPYLSPEQLEGDPATRQTDVYAASVVFWELLTSRRLFEGADDAEILRNILMMEVKPPSHYNPLVPSTVDDVVLQGLARDRASRFVTARAMALALEEAVHLATPTVVGAWVERLAAETLAARAAHIKELEAPPTATRRPSMPHGLAAQEADVPIPAPPPPSKRPAPPPPVPKPSIRASAPPVRPPAPSLQAIEQRTVIYEPPPMPEPEFVEGVRPIDDAPPPATVPSHLQQPQPPPAGALRKPELEIRNVDWLAPVEPEGPPKGAAFRRFLRYLAVFLFLMLVTAYMFAPALVRAWIVTGAQTRGVTVTIERVDVSWKEIRLVDTKAESAELPGASFRAGAVVIGLNLLVPERITVDDGEVFLDGAYGTIGERVDAFRARHPRVFAGATGGIRRIEVTSGRVDWKNVIGKDTSALVENIALDISRIGVRALGDDYHLAAPLFTMKIGEATSGPWQLDLDRQGILSRAIVRFDPSGSYPASLTRTAADDGSQSISFQVPLTRLRDLHLPPSFLGSMVSDRTRLEAHGELSLVVATAPQGASTPATVGRSVSGHLALSAYSLPVFSGGTLVDLTLDLPIEGDAAQPIALNGALSIAPADPTGGVSNAIAAAKVTGTLDVAMRVARVALAGKSGPIACVKEKGDRANPTTGVTTSIAFSFDDYPGAKVSFKPLGSCPPKLR